MHLKVKVHPNSSRTELVKKEEDLYEVYLKEKPVDGKANLALIKLLSEELGVSSKNINIKNPKSRYKLVEII